MLVTQSFLTRTMRVAFGSRAGTAILMHDRGVDFLVTARHLIRGAPLGLAFTIRYKNEWMELKVRASELHPNHDVAIVVPENSWGSGLSMKMMGGQIANGQDVAFLGYPLDMEIADFPNQGGWPLPLQKAGMFSGVINPQGHPVLVFDALNNRGFSGGPILASNIVGRALGKSSEPVHIVGIVSAYKPDSKLPVLWEDESGETIESRTHYVRPNSGFMYGVGTQAVFDLLSSIDLGPPQAPL